jgi:hypothetical protein
MNRNPTAEDSMENNRIFFKIPVTITDLDDDDAAAADDADDSGRKSHASKILKSKIVKLSITYYQ